MTYRIIRPQDLRSTQDEHETRLLTGAAATQDDPDAIRYQHSVLCQTCLPYRDPGDDVRTWKRRNGLVHLSVGAGQINRPGHGLVDVGLPFGPKPRLILAHLNAEALRHRSPEIEIGRSLTAFAARLRLDVGGRTKTTIRDQLDRLSASHVTLGLTEAGRAVTVHARIVSRIELWPSMADGEPTHTAATVRLSEDYWVSLTRHAVPLHDAALLALANSAMALDLYAWLAQRLHRIRPGSAAFVPWSALHEQFGDGYARLRKFREVFTRTMRVVQLQYRAARVEQDDEGLHLRHSASPVRQVAAVVKLPSKIR